MPNWCNNDVYIEGSPTTLKRIYSCFLQPDGTEKLDVWIPELLEDLLGDWRDLAEKHGLELENFRGRIYYFVEPIYGRDPLHICIDSAWDQPDGLYHLLEKELGVRCWYIGIEPGTGYCCRHDNPDDPIFPEDYVLIIDYEDPGSGRYSCSDEKTCESEQAAIAIIQDFLAEYFPGRETEVQSLEDARRVLGELETVVEEIGGGAHLWWMVERFREVG